MPFIRALAIVFALSATYSVETANAEDADRPNVLLICVDDLRPALGCYGDPVAKTPHVDRLAKAGVVFRRAYCQLPSCCPSRTSFLTGLRIETTKVDSNGSPHFREFLPEHVTLPQHFKRQGYDCRELGKVFHRRDPVSWSEPKWVPPAEYAYPIYGSPEIAARQRAIRVTPKPDDWWGHERWVKDVSLESADVPDEALFDGRVARKAVELLREERDRSFFLAVGFFRPHLPFVAPRKYFDRHPLDSLRLPGNDELPAGAPRLAGHASPEARSYTDVPRSGEFDRDRWLRWLQAYHACVSYVDAQVGLLLDELEARGQRENTVVVLLSDHGYHLGEHGMLGKKTNFEEATRSTLIVSAPGVEPATTDGLVELVDLYPSLCELCGLPTPDGLEGVSFVPLAREPERSWKSAVFSQAGPRRTTGYSIRTDRHRYTEYRDGTEVVAAELYDLGTNASERRNLADDPQHARLRDELRSRLRAGWRKALPAR